MRFFAVSRLADEDNKKRVDVLQQACDAKGIEFHNVIFDKVDFTNLPETGAGDIVYQVDSGAMLLERLLLGPQVATFYESFERSFFQQIQLPTYFYHAIPMPKTVPYVSANPELLETYVEYLGGFPIIAKVLGKSHGAGVAKISSSEELLETLEHGDP